ncbi:MAG: gliding motility-associated C-terminal domain-containing protein [Bacteroidales bacterium]|jgi:gliding motility-associated-like protein|nr:gliding motility-associated C-terminal domain-containing protein [Bacteroidales bacterium]MDD4213790.1 gliding motility-associated C-terminal domain-containing protein [Bacteroidales bacterium]
MKKIVLIFLLWISALSGFNQTLGGYVILDYLISAEHPYGCEPEFVTGPPDDSIWVNLNNNDTMRGLFINTWLDTIGSKLLLETGYHPSNYQVKLLLTNNLYSVPYNVDTSEWIQICDTLCHNLWADCTEGVQEDKRFILLLDFALNFGLTNSDTVKGIEIIFKNTIGLPDLAGVYVCGNKINNSINIGKDTILCDGNILMLNATTPNATYLWQDNSLYPTYSVFHEGIYWVVVTQNCVSFSDTIAINYENCVNNTFIPNIFSPNADGQNDVFRVRGENIETLHLAVYNRWGEKVFESESQNDGWDGNYKGKPCSADVYVYHATIIFEDGTETSRKGNVTLVR